MKRFAFGGSCLMLLVVCGLSSAAALFLLSIFFQQSQAATLNVTATIAAHSTSTVMPRIPSATLLPTALPLVNSTDADVTIQIETRAPDAPLATSTPLSASTFMPTASSPTATALVDAPPAFGTSSYPLTVTAEVLFGLTNVARYQSNVAATRTAIVAESVGIYATLTANAPPSP